ELGVTWTPESCMYKAFESLGSDPYQREALRLNIMFLGIEANARSVSSKEFKTAHDRWTRCLGHSSDPMNLMVAVDDLVDPDDPRLRRGGERSCLSEEIRGAVVSARSSHHLRAAISHHEIVEAWVALVDH